MLVSEPTIGFPQAERKRLLMKLMCPWCQQIMTNVPDEDAGKAINCTSCGKAFAAPQNYVAPVVEKSPEPSTYQIQSPPVKTPKAPLPAEPPLLAPTSAPDASAKFAPSTTPNQFGSQSAEGRVFRGITLRPEILPWIPAIALTLALILSMFRWVGSYPAGYPAYTQNAWQALFGDFSKDAVAEDEFKLETKIKEKIKMNWWLLPYLPLLLAGVVIAWAGPAMNLIKFPLPPVVLKIWPYRPVLLAAVAVFTLMIISAQWANGFGIEKALIDLGEVDHAETKSAATTPEKLQRWEMKVAKEIGGYQLQTTTPLRLAWLAHLLTVLAVGLEAAGALRRNNSAIRVGFEV